MSSLTRRLEIRSLKARGFARTPYRIVKDAEGRERPQPMARGGLILDAHDRPVGYRWPRIVDMRAKAAA